jgi:hypothetical protein
MSVLIKDAKSKQSSRCLVRAPNFPNKRAQLSRAIMLEIIKKSKHTNIEFAIEELWRVSLGHDT